MTLVTEKKLYADNIKHRAKNCKVNCKQKSTPPAMQTARNCGAIDELKQALNVDDNTFQHPHTI